MDRNVTIISDLEGKKIVLNNIFYARMLVRHSEDDKKYLYDLLAIKKK